MEYDSIEEIAEAFNSPIKDHFFAFFFSPKVGRFPGIFIHFENNTILFLGEITSGKMFGIPMGKQKTDKLTKQFTKQDIAEISLVLKKDAEQFCKEVTSTPPTGYKDFTKRKRFFRDYVTQIVLQSGEVLYFEPSHRYEIIDTLLQDIRRDI